MCVCLCVCVYKTTTPKQTNKNTLHCASKAALQPIPLPMNKNSNAMKLGGHNLAEYQLIVQGKVVWHLFWNQITVTCNMCALCFETKSQQHGTWVHFVLKPNHNDMEHECTLFWNQITMTCNTSAFCFETKSRWHGTWVQFFTLIKLLSNCSNFSLQRWRVAVLPSPS